MSPDPYRVDADGIDADMKRLQWLNWADETENRPDDLALVETPGYGPRVLCPRHQRGTEIMEGRQ